MYAVLLLNNNIIICNLIMVETRSINSELLTYRILKYVNYFGHHQTFLPIVKVNNPTILPTFTVKSFKIFRENAFL